MYNFFICLTIISIFVSCQNDESLEKINYDDLKIDTTYISNIENGVEIEVKLQHKNKFTNYEVVDHGIVYFQVNSTKVDSIKLGKLSNNIFKTTIEDKLIKNSLYNLYGYIKHPEGIIKGKIRDFTSIADVNVIIKDIFPTEGFINDTITIIGSNFCSSTNNYYYQSRVMLNNISHTNIIYESDTLIKAKILNMRKSKAKINIITCGGNYMTDYEFKLNPPTIDSISSKELYPLDTLKIYGKNIWSGSITSKVFIGGVKAKVVNTNTINELSTIIPNGLATNKLNIKVQVFDQSVEKENIYQSTTPFIESIFPTKIAFLDTLTIKGNYLLQNNATKTAKVLYSTLTILNEESTNKELKVVLDKDFRIDDPQLNINTGFFEIKTPILEVLPPEIISLDKDTYHLNDDIFIKTKNYIEKQGFTIGYMYDGINSPHYVNNNNIDLNMGEWLSQSKYANYKIDNGEVDVVLSNYYGQSIKKFKVYPPKITSVINKDFFLNERVYFTGTDFGSLKNSKIYIDGNVITKQSFDSPSIANQSAYFDIPETLFVGEHEIKMITGGQESNTIKFTIKNITASNISPLKGNRTTLFTVTGDNLENGNSGYGFQANGYSCERIYVDKNTYQFKLPRKIPLADKAEIEFIYGPAKTSLGIIDVQEPYNIIEEYQNNQSTNSLNSIPFEYDNDFYYLGYSGIYKFNFDDYNWELINNSDITKNLCISCLSKTTEIITIDDIAYFPNDFKSLHTFDFNTKIWSQLDLNLENNEILKGCYGKVDEKTIILGIYKNNKVDLYTYDIETNQKKYKLTTANKTGYKDIYFKDDKIFFTYTDREIHVYDIKENSWNDISLTFGDGTFYGYSLYLQNNNLYLSGGANASGPTSVLYAYNFNTKQWSEKIPITNGLVYHVTFSKNNKLYFAQGALDYSFNSNNILLSYAPDKDPL